MKPGERQIHFRLHGGRGHDAHPGSEGARHSLAQDRRLADARFAADQKGAAAAARAREQLIDLAQLVFTANQRKGW